MAGEETRGALPPVVKQWWMVVVLTCLNAFAYIDKNIVALMIGSIQRDLDLTPTQATLAIGSAFAIANVLIAVPAGILADRINRRLIIWVAATWWSIMTILCGAVTSFLGLVLVRISIGFAEGLLPPACYSLIRDNVSVDRRARALSIFSMGTLAGSGIAFLGGGVLLSIIYRSEIQSIALFHDLPAWGIALVIVGLMGIPLSLLAFTIRDDRKITEFSDAAPGFSDVLQAIGGQWKIFLYIGIFSVANAMMANSVALWSAPLAESRFGLTQTQIGIGIGLQLLILGPLGLFSAGYTIDRLERRTDRGIQIVALTIGVLLLPPAIFTPLASTTTHYWIWQSMNILGSATYLVITASLVAKLLPTRMIGRTMGLFLLLQGLIGMGLAPTITAFLVETTFNGTDQPVALAMSTAHGIFASIALVAAIALFRQKLNEKRNMVPDEA